MRRLPLILCMIVGYALGVVAQGPITSQQGPIISSSGGAAFSLSGGSCGATVGVQSVTAAGVVTCWAAATFAAATGPHTITGVDAASSLIFPTITYTSNMTNFPLMSVIATENTAAGTHDYLKMAVTATAGTFNFIDLFGGVAGATAEFSVGSSGQVTSASRVTAQGYIGNGGSGNTAYTTAASYPANQTIFDTSGTSGSSNTGSNSVSSFTLGHTLNTSGVPSVFKLAVTDTAHGTNTLLWQILGGVGAATNELSLDTSGILNVNGYKNNGVLLCNSTAPTIASGFGSSPSVSANNGSCAFTINVGTGASASSGYLTMPAAATNWVCVFDDRTTPGINETKQTGPAHPTSVGMSNINTTTGAVAAWGSADTVSGQCFAM